MGLLFSSLPPMANVPPCTVTISCSMINPVVPVVFTESVAFNNFFELLCEHEIPEAVVTRNAMKMYFIVGIFFEKWKKLKMTRKEMKKPVNSAFYGLPSQDSFRSLLGRQYAPLHG